MSDKKQTAMMEMLEWTRKTFPMDLDTPRMIEEKIESLLPKEKEQIEKSFQHSIISFIIGKILSPQDYYNETYGKE
jgi:hypothetical protein